MSSFQYFTNVIHGKWIKVSLPVLKFTVDSALFLSGLVKDAASLLRKTTSSIMTDSTCSTYKYCLWLRTMAGCLINVSSNASSVPCANLFLNKKSHLLLHSHLIKMQWTTSKDPELHCAPSWDSGHRFQTTGFLSGIRNTEGKLKSKQKNPGDGCALTFVTTYSEFKMLRYLPEGGNSEPSQKAKL